MQNTHNQNGGELLFYLIIFAAEGIRSFFLNKNTNFKMGF